MVGYFVTVLLEAICITISISIRNSIIQRETIQNRSTNRNTNIIIAFGLTLEFLSLTWTPVIPIQFSPQNARFLNIPSPNCGYPVLKKNKSANTAGVTSSWLGA